MSTTTLNRWELARYNAFRWRWNLRVEQKLALAVGMAIITGLLAQVRIPLPWTPVPITGQTLAVLLSGVLLGGWWGGLSMILYTTLGLAGVPWFTGWHGGLTVLMGPTGGYIIGFIFASIVIGHLTDRYVNARRLQNLLIIMLAANLVLVYVPGLLQLGLWLNLVQGHSSGLSQLLAAGFLPFVLGDLIKILLVTGIAWGITPKQSFTE